MKSFFDHRRINILNEKMVGSGPIVYWMSRDQRVKDNWALIYAQELAIETGQSMIVIFALTPTFLGATIRHYDFMLKGLEEVEADLQKLEIPFFLRLGEPAEEIINFAKEVQAGAVITDFDPIKIKRKWKEKVAKEISCALFEVDTHNVIPCWIASPKREFGAYTLRPKINKVLQEFLTKFPKIQRQSTTLSSAHKSVNWAKARSSLKVDMQVAELDWIIPGEKAAQKTLQEFIENKLSDYALHRNNPYIDAQSGLSPYLHFGQLSAQHVALEVQKSAADELSKNAFLEELIVRKELSDNFCYYNFQYDSFEGFPNWSKESLNKHWDDQREYEYSLNEFELAKTHEDLWNAAQLQMVQTGKMHGYMRMYWAKKILEWSKNPQEALKIAICLNDKYSIDGRDPNGYAGIAWSIGGVHDRAWFERPIFGKIRYMNRNGCKSKFDIENYIKTNLA